MNYYPHHLGDWLKKTYGLTMLESGAYHRLIEWYYINERALPLDINEVFRLANCADDSERCQAEQAAVRVILNRYFRVEKDGFHNQRCDEVLAKFRVTGDAQAVTVDGRRVYSDDGTPSTVTAHRAGATRRQGKYRQGIAQMRTAIGAAGIRMRSDITMAEMRAVWLTLTPEQQSVTGDVSGDVTGDVAVGVYRDVTVDVDISPIPKAKSQEEIERGRAGAASAAGSACLAMKRNGVSDVNPGHPMLKQLLGAGVTETDLSMAAATAAAKGKGFAYALAIAKGRHEEGPAQPLNGRQSHDQGVGRAWVPESLLKRSQAVLDPRTPDDPLTLEMAK